MINPNALPTSPTVQDFQNFGDNLNSTDYNDTLNAMRYMQGQRTGGLNRLPQVTVPMQEGGMMEEAITEKQNMEPEEAMLMEQVEQQDPRQPNPEAMAMAQQVASYGRGGDKLLLHVRPDELQGLASMLTITINPETGMPEAFLKGLRRFASNITKPVRKIAKSKAFKTIAPIALAIAAPYALGALAPTVFAAPVAGTTLGTAFGGALAGGTALGAGVTAGLGSLAGNLLAGRKFGDAAKAALITGATAGAMKGISNKLQPDIVQGTIPEGAGQSVGAEGYRGGVTGTGFRDTSPFTGTGASEMPLLSADTIAKAQYGNAATQAAQPIGTKFGSSAVEQAINVPVGSTGLQNISLADKQALLQASAVPAPPPPVAAEPPTFLSRLGDAKDAVISGVKDRYSGLGSFDKGALMNLGKDVLVADLGASAVEMGNAQQQALEDQQLAQAGYSVAYPSGFGTQRVIRDSSGVVVNATAQDILARALGGGRMQFAPKTTFANVDTGGDIASFGKSMVDKGLQTFAKEGGLIELAQGGEFSGMVPGDGGGMEDNVYMPIKEGPEQVGTLAVSPSEYVVDSYTMAALGNGNPTEGAKVMDKTIKQIRKKAYGDTQQPNEIDGLSALRPMAQGV